jgi:hypothetical protein
VTNEPFDLIPFCENVEQLFKNLEIPSEIQVQILRPYLSEKSQIVDVAIGCRSIERLCGRETILAA